LSIFPCSGNTHDDTLLAKIETVYTGSGEHGSSMVRYELNSVLQFKYVNVSYHYLLGFAVCPKCGTGASSFA
jgi:hypothetical protein